MHSKKNLRVAILVRANKVSGAERRAITIARELSKRDDVDVELWLDGKLNDIVKDFDLPQGLKVTNYGTVGRLTRYLNRARHYFILRRFLGINILERVLRKPRIQQLCAEHEIDVLHIFLDNAIEVIPGVCQIREVTAKEEATLVSNLPAYLRSRFYFNAVSSTVLGMLTDTESASRRDTIGIPFHFDRHNGNAPSNLLKENRIIWAHRMIPRKNGVLYARAIRRFIKERPDWKIDIFGSGPDEPNIREALGEEIDNPNITVGYCSTLPQALERSAVFVSLIEPDNYPSQSVFEAMTLKNALLLSDTGSTREMLFKENGLLCQLSEDEILEALLSLTENTERRVAMGDASKRLMEERYDSDRYMERLIEIYNHRFEHYQSSQKAKIR